MGRFVPEEVVAGTHLNDDEAVVKVRHWVFVVWASGGGQREG